MMHTPVDILALLGGSTRYNLHSHTQFCDGHADMDAFADAAVSAGFTHYGFSPHSPVSIPSPCNMPSASVPEYLATVSRLQQKYAGRIRFLASMEIDYLGPEEGPASAYFQELPLDYRIGSVHFISNQQGELFDIDGSFERFSRNMQQHFENDIRYVVEEFYRRSVDMVRGGGFDIIGHLDKIAQNATPYAEGVEDRMWYKDAAHSLIDAVTETGITVEINTKAYEKTKRIFPTESLVRELKLKGVPMVVNSDAHYPGLIDSGRDYGLWLLRSARSFSFPV